MWPEFFLQTLLGLVINEVWDFTVEKIKKVYKEHTEVPEGQKTFQSRMYTAIIDAFCNYTGINPDEAQDDVMDFICSTAKEYFDQSYKNQDTTIDALLSAIKTLESRFDNTLLEKKNTEDINKILFISDYIQRYIAIDQEFRHIYVIKALDYLRRIGVQIKENQLDLKLFAEEAINKAEKRLAVLIRQGNDQVIEEIKQDNKKQTDEIKQDNREQTREQTKVLLAAIDKSSQHNNTKDKNSHNEEKPQFKDAKEMYVKKWKERLFLHRRPEDKPLTLKNTFFMPSYKEASELTLNFRANNASIQNDKDEKDDLTKVLDDFFENGGNYLILGQPGMGKSSIVCFLANKYINNTNILIIRFRDLKLRSRTGEKITLLNSILSYLGCLRTDLTNKTIILDGYDEIKAEFYNYNLLNDFLLDIRIIENLSILITSRENYIGSNILNFHKTIILMPFSDEKIVEFAKKIKNKNFVFNSRPYYDTRDVFGIPVILYMALTTDVNLSNTSSRISAYEKIFALNGGIFDRFYTKDNQSYEKGSHNITYVKLTFYKILCETAFFMFKDNDKNSITQTNYKKIVEREIKNGLESKANESNSPLWYDFPIDNLYEKGYMIEFIHKSIYEYFVAEYIYEQIFNTASKSTIEDWSKVLVNILYPSILTYDILLYIQFHKKKYLIDEKNFRNKYIKTMTNILSKGPSFYLSKNLINEIYKKTNHSIKTIESIIFCNLVNLMCIITDRVPCNYKPNELVTYIISYIRSSTIEGEIKINNFNITGATFDKKNIKSDRDLILTESSDAYVLAGASAIVDDLSHCIIKNIKLTLSYIISLSFEHTKLDHINFDYTSLYYINMKFCEMIYCTFYGSKLRFVGLNHSLIKYTEFNGCDCKNVDFNNCHLINVKFIKGQSEQITFKKTIFVKTHLGSDFSNVTFENAEFSAKTTFKDGFFINANFTNTKFINADLRGGIFTGADFRGADLSGAIYDHELDDAILD